MDLDPNFHRTIRKKFPRLRYYPSNEAPTAMSQDDACSFRTEYVKENVIPESKSGSSRVCPSNYFSPPTCIQLSKIVRNPSEKEESDTYVFERLRSLSPGKGTYEQGAQSIPGPCRGGPNEYLDHLNKDPLPFQGPYDALNNAGLDSNDHSCKMSITEDRRNHYLSSSTNRQHSNVTSADIYQDPTNGPHLPHAVCNKQAYLNDQIEKKYVYISKDETQQFSKAACLSVDSEENKFSSNSVSGPHKQSCDTKYLNHNLSYLGISKHQISNYNDHLNSGDLLQFPTKKQSDIPCLVITPSETTSEINHRQQDNSNPYLSTLLHKEGKIRSSLQISDPLALADGSSTRLSESPGGQKSGHGSELPDGNQIYMENTRCSDFSSCPTSPETLTFSDDSQRYSPFWKETRQVNAFQSAHNELLLETPLPPQKPSRSTIGDPPELIPLTGEKAHFDEDYFSDQSNNEDDPNNPRKDSLPDTSNMSSETILELIQEPLLSHSKLTNPESLNSYLEPHEVGHMNHLIKCYADSLFTMYIPQSPKESNSNTSSPVYIMDIHMCGLMQIYYILFKSEDFLNLSLHDQEVLLECGILPALISLGIPLYKVLLKGWTLPSLGKDRSPFFLATLDFNAILPKYVVDRTMLIYELSHKLDVDWTISMLFLMIFLFTPVKRFVAEEERIGLIRTNYVKLLLKYLEWKHGSSDASLIFPELLKLMDAILRHCQETENLSLNLNSEEISAFYEHFRTLKMGGSLFSSELLGNLDAMNKDEQSLGHLSYYSLHSRLSSAMVKCLHIDHEERSSESSNDGLRIGPPHSPLNLTPASQGLTALHDSSSRSSCSTS